VVGTVSPALVPVSCPSTRRNSIKEQQHMDRVRLAQLEQRVQVLEDVNAIRHLKARYAAYCDDQYNPEGLAALFTEDAVWESQGLGRFERIFPPHFGKRRTISRGYLNFCSIV